MPIRHLFKAVKNVFANMLFDMVSSEQNPQWPFFSSINAFFQMLMPLFHILLLDASILLRVAL